MPQTRYDGPNDEQQLTATRAKGAAARGHLRRFSLWLVAMSLVMGVLTTIAVAWSAAAFGNAETSAGDFQLTPECCCWIGGSPGLTVADSGFGFSYSTFDLSAPPHGWIRGHELVHEPGRFVKETAAGWPFRALYGRLELLGHPELVESYIGIGHGRGALRFGVPVSAHPARSAADFRLLPLRPLPLAFLGDSLVFAGIWALVFLEWLWRYRNSRRKRRRCGRCVRCAYFVAGTSHNICPECGLPIDAPLLRYGRAWTIGGAAVAIAAVLLLSAVVLVGYANRPKLPPLYDAVVQGHTSRVRSFLKAGADPNAGVVCVEPSVSGIAPIKLAAWFARVELMKLLLAAGADLNWPDTSGRSTLAYAIRSGSPEAVHLLIEHGLDPNEPLGSSFGRQIAPFEAAIYESAHPAAALQSLIDAGVDVNQVGTYWTPLIAATVIGDADLVRYLLERGADPNFATDTIEPAICRATTQSSSEVVRVLLDGGADIAAAEKRGYSPLFHLEFTCKREVLDVLLQAGADVNFTSPDEGETPLIRLARISTDDYPAYQRTLMRQNMRLLLDAGADVNLIDNAGKSALHYAAEHQDIRMCRLLLGVGADASIADSAGRTAIDYVLDSKNPPPKLEALLREATQQHHEEKNEEAGG
jgi:ankyrin repeat protein